MASDKSRDLVSVLDSLVSSMKNNLTTFDSSSAELDNNIQGQVDNTDHVIDNTDHVTSNNILSISGTKYSGLVDALKSVLNSNSTNGTLNKVHKITTDTLNNINSVNLTTTEVTLITPEVTQLTESDGLITTEQVVIGAAVVVAVLTVIAILLRVCIPLLRNSKNNPGTPEVEKIGIESDEPITGYTNLGVDFSSNSSGSSQSQDWSQSSSGSGTTASTDWSEISSNQTKPDTSSTGTTESEMARKLKHGQKFMSPSDIRASTTSTPMFFIDERMSTKSTPIPNRRSHDETVSVISAQTLEPLRMEQAYRNRWDDQWDPEGAIPRGNLSHHSHPSESRISLNSVSTSSSGCPFPVPHKDVVMKLHMDKDRRYPSNTRIVPAVKKEKHTRFSAPN